MRAIFIAVGSEMLHQDRVDSNSLYMARRLREKGILTDLKMVVGDSLENLTWVVKKACKHAQLVILTGGLGPTEDDITREAVANALKRNLVFREELVEEIRHVFRSRGISMPEINTRQAFVIDGAEVLANRVGTAPGQWIDEGHCRILLLPGPPNEMSPMFEEALQTRLEPLSNFFIYARILKLSGISESEADALASPIYSRYENPVTTILASPGVIEFHLLGRSRKSVDEAERLTDELAEKLADALQPHLFAESDITLEAAVIQTLIQRGVRIAVAESCTGGMLGGLLTSVPGSSETFLGGMIAYSNGVKETVLGVSAHTLKKHGAVSEEAAMEMAAGARKLTGAEIAVAVTGIAGPGGGTTEKPVGLVYISIDSPWGGMQFKCIFPGDRASIRLRVCRTALDLLRRHLQESPQENFSGH